MNDWNIELSYDSFMAALAGAFIEGRDKAESNHKFADSDCCKQAQETINNLKRMRGQDVIL